MVILLIMRPNSVFARATSGYLLLHDPHYIGSVAQQTRMILHVKACSPRNNEPSTFEQRMAKPHLIWVTAWKSNTEVQPRQRSKANVGPDCRSITLGNLLPCLYGCLSSHSFIVGRISGSTFPCGQLQHRKRNQHIQTCKHHYR